MCKSKSIVLSIVDCTGIVCFAIVTVNRQSPGPACQMPCFPLLYAFRMQAAVPQRFTLSLYMHEFLPHKDTLLSSVICLPNASSSSFQSFIRAKVPSSQRYVRAIHTVLEPIHSWACVTFLLPSLTTKQNRQQE